MPVFYIDDDAIRPPRITIRGPLARHLACALRMRPGERCQFADTGARRYVGELTTVTPTEVVAAIVHEEAPPPPLRPVTLAAAIIKGHRMDWLLQKAAELGATRIVPLTTSRTIVQPRRERLPAQQRRWAAILQEAAQQTGRDRPPELGPPCGLRECLTATPAETARWLLWESESRVTLAELVPRLPAMQPILLLVGPEGGFSAEEVAEAEALGAETVSVGPLTLRAETAALAALALIHGAAPPERRT
jgi:16S rRNA (uracil1498-N3)-methyltransferase